MKIGLKYIEVGHGTGDSLPTINNGGWNQQNNFITEFGRKLTDIGIPAGDTRSVGMGFKYIPSGLLVCLVKRMEVRGDSSRSNQALWIFVPSQISMGEEDLQTMLADTKKMFDNPMSFANAQRFTEAVPEIYKKDFPLASHPYPSGNMSGDTFAVINCNADFTPAVILDFGYKRVYGSYGLILMNLSGMVSPGVPQIDLTSLKKSIWVNWPVRLPQSLSGAKQVAIYIDRQAFSPAGAYVEVGPHKVVLQQKGFEPVESVMEISASNADKPLDLGSDWQGKKWMKKVNLYNWEVVNERKSSIINDCAFRSMDSFDANGRPMPVFRAKDQIFVPADKCKTFELEVDSQGYESLKTTVDLTSPAPVILTMKKQPKITETPASRKGFGGTGRFDYDGNSGSNRIQSSPNNQTNKLQKQLVQEQKSKKLWLIISLIACAAAVIFLILWLVKGSNEEPSDLKNNATEQVINEPYEEERDAPEDLQDSNAESPQGSPQLSEAIYYLDTNEIWRYEEMSRFNELDGLYSDLNTFNWEALTNIWGPKLKESQRFQTIVEQTKQNLSRSIPHAGKYYENGNEPITISKYVITISNMRLDTLKERKAGGQQTTKPQENNKPNPEMKVSPKNKENKENTSTIDQKEL